MINKITFSEVKNNNFRSQKIKMTSEVKIKMSSEVKKILVIIISQYY